MHRQIWSLAFFTLIAGVLVACVQAWAVTEKRVALVVGNATYQNAGTLTNPTNDARDVATALTSLGFQVILGTDLDKRGLDNKLREFARSLEGADVGLFFYAGHGLQVKGLNYLIGTDAKLEAERDLDFEATKLDSVLTHMEREAKTNIVFLDACRNNPLARNLARTMGTRGVGEGNGLAPVASALGTFIAYATQPGNVAGDGDGRNSPFTTALKKHISEPGLALGDLMIEVRKEVVAATSGMQVPWDHSALQGRFYFAGQSAVAASEPQAKATMSEAAEAWDRTKDSTSIAVLEAFMARYESTFYATLARAHLDELKRQKVAVAPPPPSPKSPPPAAKPAVGVFRPTQTDLPLVGDTIKVGILHSLSGTMAITETTLKDAALMLIDEQNSKGGLLGKKLEAVVVDPASNWPLFAEKARELVSRDKVAVVFGGWTSVSRKSVIPVFKELNGLLFYPAPFEGEESERNVFYTGPIPNQLGIPAVDYLMSERGIQRWVLAGTDYVYPRTTNKILEVYLRSRGVAPENIMINYTPFGHSDWSTIIADIKKFGAAGKKAAVISTIDGDANIPFYKELANQRLSATELPVLTLTVTEEELAGIDTKNLVGHLAAQSYFQSLPNPANDAFVKRWHSFTKNPKRVVNSAVEAQVTAFKTWVAAVEKAGSIEPNKVIDAAVGINVANLSGGSSAMLDNHHVSKPFFIGQIRSDGQFDVIWRTKAPISPEPMSPYLAR